MSHFTAERTRPVERSRQRRPRWHLPVGMLAAILALGMALVAVSVIGALRTPGNEDFKAKWADWLRSHHATVLVNHLESFYYNHEAPKPGGQPKALNPVPRALPEIATGPVGAGTARPVVPGAVAVTEPLERPTHLPPPSPVPLVVSPGLPSEGQWEPAGPLVGGAPAMYVSQFRADRVYTSQITSAVWIDTSVVRLSLVPGAREPGGQWSEPPDIFGPALTTAVAAFNGGFRFQDAHGGFFLDGRQAVPLRAGTASLVIHANGRVDIGVWDSEVQMTSDVVAVLQNLVPIVDQGVTAAAATYNDHGIWGATVGANTVVARSGVGVTASGALVYVAGPALTARSLAESLQRAGAVRAMALDINSDWVTFNFFEHRPTAPGMVTGLKLYPEMKRPATRYLGPTRESRDFFVISLP